MAGEPSITISGNIGSDPEMHYSPRGTATLTFSVGSTPRTKAPDSDQWIDGTTLWVRVVCFKTDAENAAATLERGQRVVVTGRLQQDDWQDKEGNKRTTMKLLADEVGVSLKWATAKVNKVTRDSPRDTPARRPQPKDDPWASSAPEDEAPF